MPAGKYRRRPCGIVVLLAQGLAGAFAVKIAGSYSSIVGLPLNETAGLLQGEAYPMLFMWSNRV